MKFATLAAATAALALTAAPAVAQEAAPQVQVTAGTIVVGPEGNTVGTVKQVADGVVLLDTGKHTAPLPANAFGKNADGAISITVTQAQLNAMLDEQLAAAQAQRDAALVAGAMVHTADDAMLGTVESVDGDAVLVARDTGSIQLERKHFAVDEQGTLVALFTVAQIDAATSASTDAGTQAVGGE